jgi:hypothetical protein
LQGAPKLIAGAGLDVGARIPGARFLWSLDGAGWPSLLALSGALSVQGGGDPIYCSNTGSGRAGGLYRLLGTTSGSSPGIPLGSFVLPLNAGGYFAFTRANANAPPLSKPLGILLADGQGTARFTLPPGSPPSLAGIAAHHASIAVDLPTLAVALASNAVPLALEN